METGAVCAGKGIKMGKAIKDFLKRILPPPVHAFNREVERILKAVDRNCRETDALRELIVAQERSLDQLRSQLDEERERRIQWESQTRDEWRAQQQGALDKAMEGQAKILATLTQSLEQFAAGLQEQTDTLAEAFAAGREQMATRKQVEVLIDTADKARRQAADSARHASEAVWAEIFNNTIAGSTWLKDVSFSPGRWAVGYSYLYVMYRVLNETRPKRILELGLGQSTRMIAQYTAAFQDVEHIVVEHDPEWVGFFCNGFLLPKNMKVVMLEREMVPYKDAEAVRVFKGFKETFQGQKFDFISVDAPLGGDMKQYARIDVLNLIPDGLSDNFVIMVDDCNRIGEAHTVNEIREKLAANQIENRLGWYNGDKSSALFCPTHMGFLCSM